MRFLARTVRQSLAAAGLGLLAWGLLSPAAQAHGPPFFKNKDCCSDCPGQCPKGEEPPPWNPCRIRQWPGKQPIGKGDVKREGEDVTIVAISRMVQQSLAAAKTLSSEGIEAEIIDPRTLSPLDEDLILSSVEKTHRLVVVDEADERLDG